MSDHVLDNLPAYSLGILDEEEVPAVREHLEDCSICRAELHHLTEIGGAIPWALDPLAPPVTLRDRVLSAARAEAQRDRSNAGPQADDTVRAGAHLFPTPAQRSARSRLLSLPFIAGYAVVLFAIGLSLGNVLDRGPSASQRYDHLVAAAVARGDRVVPLRPASHAPALVHLAVDIAPSGVTSLLMGPTSAPPANRIFQLWFIHRKRPAVSIGTFTPRPDAATLVMLPRKATGFQVGAMTVEAAPKGSVQPTHAPFVVADLARG